MNHPIFVREMQASMRLARTPWLLMILTLVLGLGLAAFGAMATSDRGTPAELGQGIFQAFFSVGYMVAMICGPAISSSMVATEREGRTWEALLLSGLTPKQIAKEKFLAGLASTSLYIVALSPVAGLSFLFGGVSATEVFLGFVVLFAVAAVASLLGTALSAVWKQQRGATVATLTASIVFGGLLFMLFGFGTSFAMHDKWNAIPEAHPIWLPLAWVRAPFGLDYVLLLLVMPVILFGTAGWFFYETAIAHMKEDTDDKASGYRRWFFWCTPALGVAAVCAVVVTDRAHNRAAVGIGAALLFYLFSFGAVLLLGAEPVTASRRVLAQLARLGARPLAGPGLVTTLGLFLFVSLATTAGMTLGILAMLTEGGKRDVGQVLSTFGYGSAFLTFVTGFFAFLRARGTNSLIARLVAVGTVVSVTLAPPILLLIIKATTDGSSSDLIPLAAPSPFYVAAMFDALESSYRTDREAQLAAGVLAILGWATMGATLLAFSYARARAAKKASAPI
jgi:hypothetical protein